MRRGEPPRVKWVRALVGGAIALPTFALCLRVVLDHGAIGELVPTLVGILSVSVAGLGGIGPLLLRRSRRQETVGVVRVLVEVLSDWTFFLALLLVLFACSLVIQYSTGYGDASSVYYQAFALSAIFLATVYSAAVYVATVYYPFQRRISWVWVQVAIFLVVAVMVLHWERQGRLQWHKGLHLEGIPHSGAIDPDASHCQIGLNYWRLRYTFPKRFFNLWAGSLHCDDSRRPSMQLRTLPDGSGRELLLECNEGERATYMEGYPFLRSTSLLVQSTFPPARVEAARNAMAELKPYDRKHPPIITAQHVQGFCGEREAALVHAVPPSPVTRAEPGPVGRRKKKLNILLVMFDAVSRAEFHYSLPGTARMLEELNNNPLIPFSVFEYFRYQTTGRTTLPNLTSLFSGMSQPMRERHVREWRERAPKLESRLGLIFRQFKRQHQQEMFPGRAIADNDYTTAFLIGSCNAQLEEYWNTTAAEQLVDIELVEFFCHGDFTGNSIGDPFQGSSAAARRCIAGKPVHQYLFEMMDSILENAEPKDAKPAFVMSEFQEGHETSMEVLSVVDEDLADFLDGVTEKHPDTLIVLFSDHGNHMTMLANYPGGDQEQGLGSLFVITPNWIFDHYPSYKKHLAENQQKIVTMADVYAMLLHLSILYGPAPDFPPPSDKPERLFTSKLDRASEGLMQHIPDRTCEKARVPPYRCRCEPL